MVGEWQILSLRGAGVQLLDCEHRTPPAAKEGFLYVAIPQIKNGRIDLTDIRRISYEHFISWTRKTKPQSWDVVLSRRCNPGETAFMPADLEFALGQNLVLLRADGTKVYPPFLRWLVRGPEWWEQIGTFINVGAIFDSLKCADIPNFELLIPPVPEQRAIAYILGTLDDKIELNRKMNRILEAMAQALFKSWFVDFDPVRAKAEGRDPGLPKKITDLFPDSFENSQLGEIPRGWRVCRWGDEVVLEYGKSLRNYAETDGPYVVYGTNGPIGRHSAALCQHPGIIIGRKGAYRGIHFADKPFFVIDTAFYIEPKTPINLRWAYYVLLNEDINGMDSGSAIPSTSRNDFYNMPLLLPPYDLQRFFYHLCSASWDKQSANDTQSRSLSAIRDALLPKLISGELRVKDAERFSEMKN